MIRGSHRATAVALGVLVAALAGLPCPACSERPARAPEPRQGGDEPVPRAPGERAPLEDPGALTPTAAPDAGDIAAEVSAFDGFERCRARLQARLPPAVSEVLSDVGYQGAASDACMAVQALADRSPELCDRLQVRATREGCLRRYAMFNGEPDRCPDEIEHAGREPLCVAVAMRDPSMCAAELDPARVGLCRAIVLRNERPCRVAHTTLPEVQRCAREAGRWWGAVPPSRPRQSLPNDFTPSFTFCEGPSPAGDADAAAPRCADVAALVARGVVLRPERGLVIGARSGPLLGPRAPAVELRTPLPPEGGELPSTTELASDGATAWIDLEPWVLGSEGEACLEGSVTLERFEPRRGSILAGTYELGACGEAGDARRFHGAFRAFVRDVMAGPPRSTDASTPE